MWSRATICAEQYKIGTEIRFHKLQKTPKGVIVVRRLSIIDEDNTILGNKNLLRTSPYRRREISRAFAATQARRPAGEDLDLEVGVPLEDIAVEEMHEDRLARCRGPAHKDNAVLKNPVVKTSNNNWPRAPCWIASEPGVWWGGGVGTRKYDESTRSSGQLTREEQRFGRGWYWGPYQVVREEMMALQTAKISDRSSGGRKGARTARTIGQPTRTSGHCNSGLPR